MLDRIEYLMESVRQIGNNIAHDLRTPLGRLRQSLDEVRSSARSPADYEQAVDHAISEADSILGTFAALLRIAQIESGSRRSAFQMVDLSDLIISMCQAYAPSAEGAGKLLRARIASKVTMDGDRELLAQMLANLFGNAITHTPPGTQITVSLDHDESGSTLCVADNGPGVPAGERQRILERFYRLERSRTKPGNGLGLSLVAAIADLHQIGLEIGDNRPGLLISLRFPPNVTATPTSMQRTVHASTDELVT
jgi:signal transduction histidine kinase